jgi:1-acyl-sn-glycerol-3-phosphate acyltransferase
MTVILPRAFREDPSLFDGSDLGKRDPAYIRDYLPLLEILYRYYFRVLVRGFDAYWGGRPFIMVGNHNGGINSPDTAMTLHAWFTHQGVDVPVHALIHPDIFKIQYLNVHIMKFGGVAATARMAMKVLESGAPLLLYPGAGDDAYKPFEDRHKIMLFGRDAFVRLALRMGVPVIPVVSIGAHETLIVLDDGRDRACELGLDKLGVERLPLTYSMPLGWTLGSPFNIPFPAQISIEMGVPINFSSTKPHADRDPATVKRCYDAVVQVMQSMLDRMVQERAAARANKTTRCQ